MSLLEKLYFIRKSFGCIRNHDIAALLGVWSDVLNGWFYAYNYAPPIEEGASVIERLYSIAVDYDALKLKAPAVFIKRPIDGAVSIYDLMMRGEDPRLFFAEIKALDEKEAAARAEPCGSGIPTNDGFDSIPWIQCND